MSPAKATKMDEEVLKWSRKDPSAIKRAMAYPGGCDSRLATILSLVSSNPVHSTGS